MDSHSIAARPSATTENNATNLSDERRRAYAAGVSIRTGRPSEAEGKTILPGAETCCDGQPPRIATSRRLLLAGLAVLPLSACPVPVPARTAGVCAKLAELIDVANDISARHDHHYVNVETPADQRAAAAIERLPHFEIEASSPDKTYWTTANPNSVRVARSIIDSHADRGKSTREELRQLVAAGLRRERQERRIRREVGYYAAAVESNAFGEQCAVAEWNVAGFPVTSPADFHAKIAFMIERQMFDGIDHSEQMLADAARLAGVGA